MAWVSPTGFSDPNSDWTNETNVYDDDTTSYASASTTSGAGDNTQWIELTIDDTLCDSLRYWEEGVTNQEYIDLQVYYNADWHTLVDGGAFDPTKADWTIIYLDNPQHVTKMRIYFTTGAAVDCRLYEVDFGAQGRSGKETRVRRRVSLTPYRLVGEEGEPTISLVYPAYR